MINKLFTEKIGRNVEVYVDDIVVKSEKVEKYVDDLMEIFNVLRNFKVKFNPKKCIFGMAARKFLGFMVSQRGIEANPKIIKAIIEMKPQSSVKVVQRLIGRIKALNHFMSKQ